MNLKPKKCVDCKTTFKPSGPRSLRCVKCKGKPVAAKHQESKPRRVTTSPRTGNVVANTVSDVTGIRPGEDRSFPRPLGDEATAHVAEVVDRDEGTSGDSDSDSGSEVRGEVDPALRETFCNTLMSGCEMYGAALTREGISAPPKELYGPWCLLSTKCAERFGLFNIVEDDKWYLLAGTIMGGAAIYGPPTVELVKRVKSRRAPKPGPIPYTTAEPAPGPVASENAGL